MTTLAGISLSDSLFLNGVETENVITVNVLRSLTGEAIPQAATLSGGNELELMTVTNDGSLTGKWCQHQLDALKIIMKSGLEVPLIDRYGRVFNVILTDIDVNQYDQREPVSPAKVWVGSVTMIEV
jgi:hypothetical protein